MAMASNDHLPAKLPILDSKNYDRWAKQMKVVFRYQEVVDVVETGIPAEVVGEVRREWEKKDSKVLFLIHQSVDEDAFEKISEYDSAKECWDTLSTVYSGDDKLKQVKLNTLRREYELLAMNEKETIAEYFNRLTKITNQLRLNGKTVSERKKIDKVIRTLTPNFDYVVTSVEQSKDLDTLKLTQLQGILEANEVRILRAKGGDKSSDKTSEKTSEQVLLAQSQNKKGNWGKNKKGKGKWNKGGEGSSKNGDQKSDFQKRKEAWKKNKGEKKKLSKKEIQCYNCEKFGHYADECKTKNTQEEAQLARGESDSDDELVLMAEIGEMQQQMVQLVGDDELVLMAETSGNSDDLWYLDTGCSSHMTGNKDWFTNLDE